MEDIIIKSSDFTPEDSNLQQLLLEVDETGYKYAIVQNQSVKLIGHHSSAKFSDNHDLFKTNFAQVKVSLTTKSFTFLPEIYFNQALAHKLKAFINFDEQHESILECLINKIDIRSVYTFKNTQLKAVNASFENPVYFPQFLPIYVGAIQIAAKTLHPEMFLNFKKEHLEILILKNGELFFYNIFEIKNKEELKYFIMLVLQEKEINAKETSIRLSGNIQTESSYFKEIDQLFTDCALVDTLPFIDADENFTEKPMHQFFSLLSLSLCE
ncbi:hypothetical protein PBAC_04880 [Pedobacter glucosidilyticus]|nr:DUF3822 family protein [Pedobacter glucosidilyticus]KHJ39176.1 hypothetical protein PBAC_04880 [Pedobacter glucosidilyticus]